MSLLKTILSEPFIILGICFLIFGAASIIFKVFNTPEKNKYVPGNRGNNSENKNQKKVQAFLLVVILIGLIFVIYWIKKRFS